MARLNIIEGKQEHLIGLYRHLSIQSLLDIKAVNGEVTPHTLLELYNASSGIKTVYYGDKIAYVVFIIPTDVEECSVFMVGTTLGYSDTESLNMSFESIIKDLPNYDFYSIVYKGNHKFTKLLKDNGFRFVKNLIHGVEKRNFLLLEKVKNG